MRSAVSPIHRESGRTQEKALRDEGQLGVFGNVSGMRIHWLYPRTGYVPAPELVRRSMCESSPTDMFLTEQGYGIYEHTWRVRVKGTRQFFKPRG